MRYITKAKRVKNKVLVFPFGKFLRGGWRAFSRADGEEMIRNFDANLPNSRVPVNVEHEASGGRIGTFKKLWLGDEGVYGEIEWTEVGRERIARGEFEFFSAEIAWEWIDPRTGEKYYNVLVGGAMTNYPFHGDGAMLFSEGAAANFDVLHKLAVLEINPRSLRNVSDKELLSLHRRMHMLAVSLRKSSPTHLDVHIEEPFISTEDVVNAHVTIVSEMKRREMEHAPGGEGNWLDQQSKRFLKSTAAGVVRNLSNLEEQEVMIIPGFVSVVGGALHSKQPGDLDILVRANKEDGNYLIGEQNVWLPLRNLIDPHKDEGIPTRWIAGAQGPHGDALFLGDLVLKIRPRFEAIRKGRVEKDVRSYIYFVGTGALDSPRRDASLMVVSGDEAVLFDAGKDIQTKHVPKAPSIILVTDPQENSKEAKRLAEGFGVEVAHGDWGGKDIDVRAFRVTHTGHDVYGYLIRMSDLTIAYVPEFWKFPSEVANADIGIFDGSAYDRPIAFAGGKGGHAAILDTLIEAHQRGVKRTIFTHVGKPVEEHLWELQAAGVEIAQDGQSVVVKATLQPGTQNFKPLKTGRGYGEGEFSNFDVAWEVWGRENTPFAVEKKFDGWRMIAHKAGDKIRLYSEDANRDLSDKVPGVAADLRKLHGNLIIDGELEIYAAEPVSLNFEYSRGDKIERIDMPSFLNTDKPKGKYYGKYFAFDLLYRDGDIHKLPWTERKRALSRVIAKTDRLEVVRSEVVEDEKNFRRAIEAAFDEPNSEGAMLKNIAADYALDGETLEWAKVKALKEVRVRVVDKKKSGKGAWIYTGALSDGSIIGNTYATGVRAEIGDVLEMRVAEVKVKDSGRKKRFTWDNPLVASKKPKDTAVTTPAQAEAIARMRRGRKTPRPAEKNWNEIVEAEEVFDRDVFGPTDIGGSGKLIRAIRKVFDNDAI